jgi:tetratricopeptide (TPR) repeat protein
MISECNKEHRPGYNNICCLFQLLIVNEYASNQLMEARYSYIFLKTLNHHFKHKSFYIDNIKLDILKLFLEVVSKYSSQYYFNLKLNYSKMLIKIALSICVSCSYKNHPDIVERRNCILMNLSAVYVLDKNYKKAIKYLLKALPYVVSDIDRAVVYNNLARIYMLTGDEMNCLKYLEDGFKLYRDDMKNVNIGNNHLDPNGEGEVPQAPC